MCNFSKGIYEDCFTFGVNPKFTISIKSKSTHGSEKQHVLFLPFPSPRYRPSRMQKAACLLLHVIWKNNEVHETLKKVSSCTHRILSYHVAHDFLHVFTLHYEHFKLMSQHLKMCFRLRGLKWLLFLFKLFKLNKELSC